LVACSNAEETLTWYFRIANQLMKIKSQRALCRTTTLALLFCLLNTQAYLAIAQTRSPQATVAIDAGHVAGQISPLLYGQFIEFMFEGVKFGLHAELLRNRSFEEEPGATGLSRYWERYPDDRNDDYGISFSWDAAAAVPNTARLEGAVTPHALRV